MINQVVMMVTLDIIVIIMNLKVMEMELGVHLVELKTQKAQLLLMLMIINY